MINITIDGIVFEVYGGKTLWSPPSAAGVFVEAPADWASMARALVMCDYEDRDGRTYVADSKLLEHFVDTHDDQGNLVPGGRASGLHFPLKSGMPNVRPLVVMTGMESGPGMMQPEKVISVLKWDDPLDAVMTTSEAEEHYGLAVGSAKKTAQRRKIPSRKSGGTWLIRKFDAERQWR